MSFKIRSTKLAGFASMVLVGIFSGSLQANNGLTLMEINEGTDDSGYAAFTGSIRNDNSGKQPIGLATITIVLKQGERVVGTYQAREWKLDYGEVWEFVVRTTAKEGTYDQYRHVLTGSLEFVDPEYVTGEITILDSSITLTSDADGNLIMFGEMINNTNAVIGEVALVFRFYDDQDRVLGRAAVTSINGDRSLVVGAILGAEILPGETVVFEASTSDVSFGRVARWEIEELNFVATKIYDPGIATVRRDLSWGEIKDRF